MLRTNLSTRPFYNERGVHALIALLAAILVALTAWQVAEIVRLSRHKTELTATIQRDRAESEAIEVFEENLRTLLLAPPAGHMPVMGIDPGQRTGRQRPAAGRSPKENSSARRVR